MIIVSAKTVKKRWDNLGDRFVLSRVFSKNERQLYTNFIKIIEFSMIEILKIDFIYCYQLKYRYTLFPFSVHCESKIFFHVPVSVLVTVPGLLWSGLKTVSNNKNVVLNI